jgi:outer membrane receptor for ferrienterochelin and colicin
MRSFILYFTIAIVLSSGVLRAQDISIRGSVFSLVGGDSAALPGAHVRVADTQLGATTGSDGRFLIRGIAALPCTVIVSHVGFAPDTVVARDGAPLLLRLAAIRSLGAVSVEGERKGMSLAPIEFKTEVITDKELRKAPCCDLSGCFGSNASVEPEVTDIITDTRELRMIGLAGVYTHVLVDNVPTALSGLNQSYGLGFIPGTLVDRMYVTKGANSVLQGPEAISGLVNVLLREGEAKDRLFLHLFANSFHERQANVHGGLPFGKWTGFVAAHTAQPGNEIDGDSDGFLDLPKVTRYMLYNKWTYRDEDAGVMTTASVKGVDEKRVGGQRGFDEAADRSMVYGQTAHTRRLEFLDRSEFLFGESERLNVHVAASTHALRSWYGTTSYDADQRHFFADAAFTHSFTEDATLTAGASLRQLSLDETIAFEKNPLGKTYDGAHRTRETVPGIFAEQKYAFLDDAATVIAGLRADRDIDEGVVVTPRVFFKVDPIEGTSLRFSAGSGSRKPLPFVENAAFLASARNIVIPAPLQMERALNYGGSITHVFEIAPLSGTLSLDVFHTDFTHQAIADIDTDPQHVIIRSADGRSASTSAVFEFLADVGPVECKGAWTYTDAFETHAGISRSLPFLSTHKLLGAVSWEEPETGWLVSATVEWHGPQRLPNTQASPAEFRMPDRSDAFTLLNAQVAKRFGIFEVYAGLENILDARQNNPILNAKNPFGQWFEPTFVWGPVKGREIFAGLRIRFDASEEEETEE